MGTSRLGDAPKEAAKDVPASGAALGVAVSCNVVEAVSVDSEAPCRPLAVAGVVGDFRGEDLRTAGVAAVLRGLGLAVAKVEQDLAVLFFGDCGTERVIGVTPFHT